MMKKNKILCVKTCPDLMFLQGVEILKSKFPESTMDLFIQGEQGIDIEGKFRKTYILNKPFFSLFSLNLNKLLNLIGERYDVLVIFYNNPTGETYDAVKRMASALFPKEIISIYPDGRMKEVKLSEIYNLFIFIRNNVWLDGIIAGIMILIMFLVFSVFGLTKKFKRR